MPITPIDIVDIVVRQAYSGDMTSEGDYCDR